ncbi:hypothetical protein GBZ48_19235 [Azospirillum melinis]|uniref:SAM-dependent methyltransferase n=1 Tax=Azospirillum melinis TaxID=328839 RepID=A0ABX2KCR6_9PROT|nr:hypothetical protein [Azospirillum melinis]MBP2307289.1 SAM-dependent methyltransferase [Azospirillum melinis]NUB01397.1 hypothetical protein [Azospirillum melinis]
MNPLLSLVSPDRPYFPDLELATPALTDPALLQFAVRDTAPEAGAMRLLHVGAGVGASTLTLADAMGKHAPLGGTIFAVDSWDVQLRPNELGVLQRDEQLLALRLAQQNLGYELFQWNTGFAPDQVKIHTLRGPAAEILSVLACDFDLVLLEAPLYRDQMVPALERARTLVRDGGLLLVGKAQLPVPVAGDDVCRSSGDLSVQFHPTLRLDFHPGVSLAIQQEFPDALPLAGHVILRRVGDDFIPHTPISGPFRMPAHLNSLKSKFPAYRDGQSVSLQRWDSLRTAATWIYGAGEAGQRAFRFAQSAGVSPAGFIDTYRRGSQFGLEVIGPDDLLAGAAGDAPDIVIATQHWPQILPSLASLQQARFHAAILPAGDGLVALPHPAPGQEPV